MYYKKVFLFIGVSMLMVCNSTKVVLNFEDEKSGVMTLPIEDVNETIVIKGL